MNNLYLTLTKQWFNKHLEGKDEEYREIKPYWITRLFDFSRDIYPDGIISTHMDEIVSDMQDLTRFNSVEELFRHYDIAPRAFDGIIFSNGYRATRPQMKKEHLGVTVGQGREDWGAPANKMVLIILTGNILWKKNIEETLCRRL